MKYGTIKEEFLIWDRLRQYYFNHYISVNSEGNINAQRYLMLQSLSIDWDNHRPVEDLE